MHADVVLQHGVWKVCMQSSAPSPMLCAVLRPELPLQHMASLQSCLHMGADQHVYTLH